MIYKPIVTSLLPDFWVLLLLDEHTFSLFGFNLISTLIIGQLVLLALFFWLSMVYKRQKSQSKAARLLNEYHVSLVNKQRKLEFENSTLLANLAEMEASKQQPASRKKSESINQNAVGFLHVKKKLSYVEYNII